jgi:predicted DCC family thiol-disulfide oxidoreductase YuxK
MSSTTQGTCTVYFDGACPICRREIAHYRTREGAADISWVDVTESAAADLGTDLDRDAALARLHVRREDGSLVSGAAAFATIWGRLPAYAWLGRIAEWRPVLFILEAGYRGFLRARRLWRPARRSGPDAGDHLS